MWRLTILILLSKVMLIAFTTGGIAGQARTVQIISQGRTEFVEYIGRARDNLGNCQPKSGAKLFILQERLGTRHNWVLEDPDGEKCLVDLDSTYADDQFKRFFRRSLTSSDPEMQAYKVAAEKREEAEAQRRVEERAARARAEAAAKAAQADAAGRAERMRQDAEARSPLFPVIKNWFARANAGQYSDLPALYAPDAAQRLGTQVRALADGLTQNGTVARLEFVSEEIRGEGGSLQYRVFYKNGSSGTNTAKMVLQRGRWLLDVR